MTNNFREDISDIKPDSSDHKPKSLGLFSSLKKQPDESDQLLDASEGKDLNLTPEEMEAKR